MNVVLFLGTKIGYTGLKTLIDLGANIKQVFVDKEHVHEIEKYDQSIIDLCKKNDIKVYEAPIIVILIEQQIRRTSTTYFALDLDA